MRGWQPCVKRIQWYLYGKGNGTRYKNEHLDRKVQVKGHQLRDKKRVCSHIQHDQGQQQKNTADQGVEKKLNRCIILTGAAPDSNQQVHGNQHALPENIKKHRVQADKNPDHG